MRNYIKTILITLFTALLAIQAYGNDISSSPEQVLREYIAAIENRDWIKAQSLWLGDDVTRSNHLGITFANIDAKYDCASPSIYSEDSLSVKSIKFENIDSINVKANLELVYPGQNTITVPYYLTKTNDGWRLCSSPSIYAANWQTITTKYFNIYFNDSSLVNSYAIAELDDFADELIKALAMTNDKAEFLQKEKIDYYLCNKAQMIQLTGYDSHGMTSFPYDAIITRHLPHTHEITHLMINYAMQEAPLFTLPVMQEGIACCLGGRWGKSPEVINYWGKAIYDLGLADIDSILTISQFNNCSSGLDASYALSSIFAGFVLDYYGMEKLMMLYRELSGGLDDVNQFSAAQAIKIIEQSLGSLWPQIRDSFHARIEQNNFGGIIISDTIPVYSLSLPVRADSLIATIGLTDSLYVFRITMPASIDKGVILLKGHNMIMNSAYRSGSFSEQVSGYDYNKDIMYGIIFSDQEVGLYNFYTNTLLAKYANGFAPQPGYWNPDSRTITFCIGQNLIDNDLTDYEIRMRCLGK